MLHVQEPLELLPDNVTTTSPSSRTPTYEPTTPRPSNTTMKLHRNAATPHRVVRLKRRRHARGGFPLYVAIEFAAIYVDDVKLQPTTSTPLDVPHTSRVLESSIHFSNATNAYGFRQHPRLWLQRFQQQSYQSFLLNASPHSTTTFFLLYCFYNWPSLVPFMICVPGCVDPRARAMSPRGQDVHPYHR